MTTYREFIEGYESPEYSEDDYEAVIDQDIEERLSSRDKHAKDLKYEDQSELSQEPREQRNSVTKGYTGEVKSYRVLDQTDLSMFQADIRKGELSREQLREKYRVSRSTANRYIKNYREHGYVKYKKQSNSGNPDRLIKKLLAQNQYLQKQMNRKRQGRNKRTLQFPSYDTISSKKQNQMKMF